MKFSSFKEFRGAFKNSIEDVAKYLSVDITKILRELSNGLSNITFSDNFESFEVIVTIAASSELAIRNELRGKTPSKRIIVRGSDGVQNIVDGDTQWTESYVYMKNTGLSPVSVTLVFLV
jgi:hypothetical protein